MVGIDLGTTHTVVACAQTGDAAEVFPIAQIVGQGEVSAERLLPSFLFAPPGGEAPEDAWGDSPWVVGAHARQRGQEAPNRMVSSAKSWLSHARVDRNAAILPWGADDPELPRLSPVDASATLLRHVRAAWDHAHPKLELGNMSGVILTVPASFDQVARELTVQAATRAGLRVRLLEEPQAAFYDVWSRLGPSAVPRNDADALVLVVDVGGGTTDLTLISVTGPDQSPQVRRLAVGKHLLLGGDNIDLAIAHLAESRMVTAQKRLDPRRFGELVLACRSAKERLLSEGAPESVRVSVLGTGSRLVGATLKTELSRDEVRSLVLDGFVPLVEKGIGTGRARAALMAFGLPYEHDPAITRHIAAFLTRHAPDGRAPDAVLFNGGLFHSPVLTERVLEVIRSFGGSPQQMPGIDPDLAVARGAVAYGHALSGSGLLIGGGSAHGFFVALADGDEHKRAVCVVPRGAEEGARHSTGRKFALRVGAPVRFEVYATDAGATAPGDVVTLDSETHSRLAPLATTLEAADGASEVMVQLAGELSPVGTVEIQCVADEAGSETKRYQLSFDTRGEAPTEAPEDVARKSLRPGRSPSMRPEGTRFDEALAAIELVFGKSRGDVKERTVKELWRTLEKLLGDRSTWSGELSRALFDALSPLLKSRTRSAAHERVFWMLAGFTLRPGYGHPLDESRIKKIAPLFEAGLSFPGEARGWQQLWIAWRRLAGGLDEALQTRIRDRIDPFLAPAGQGPKKPKGYKPGALDEMLELAGALERVPGERRVQLGEWLIERTWSEQNPRLWSAIGKLGARVPTYGSAHYVIPSAAAERWLKHLIGEKWPDQPLAARAARDLVRVSGDRSRDLPESVRADVAKRLEQFGADDEWVRSVREHVALADADRAEFFGAELPLGLRLVE